MMSFWIENSFSAAIKLPTGWADSIPLPNHTQWVCPLTGTILFYRSCHTLGEVRQLPKQEQVQEQLQGDG
jgi:hypothetical protein